MSLFGLVLALHIAAGTVGLVLGPIAMTARKRPGLHTRAGETYHWVMLAVCVTAAALAALDWQRIWWFLPIAAGSYAFALLGYVAAKRRWKGWLGAHVTGQGGSYIAMTTAVLVVNWQALTGTRGIASPWAWALPTAVGTPLIAWANYRIARGRTALGRTVHGRSGKEPIARDAIAGGSTVRRPIAPGPRPPESMERGPRPDA